MTMRIARLPVFSVLTALFWSMGAIAQDHSHDGHAHAAAPAQETELEFVEKRHTLTEPPKDALFHFDLSQYPKDVQKSIVEEAQRTSCSCGCGMTVAYCLFADPDCPTSPGMAKKIIAKHAGAPYPEVKLNREIGTLIVGVDTEKMEVKKADALARRLEKEKCNCGCGMELLECLRMDAGCKASPLILSRLYKEVTGKNLPGAEVLALPVQDAPRYETLPRVDTSALSKAQMEKLLHGANVYFCECGKGTLAQCLNENSSCQLSVGAVNVMIFELLTEGEGGSP
jgi:hypothetical protein